MLPADSEAIDLGVLLASSHLLDVRRDAPAVEDVEAVERPGRLLRGLQLHLGRHVGVLHRRLPFQHPARSSGPTAARMDRRLGVNSRYKHRE